MIASTFLARSRATWPPPGRTAAAPRRAVPTARRAHGWRALALVALYPLRILGWEVERRVEVLGCQPRRNALDDLTERGHRARRIIGLVADDAGVTGGEILESEDGGSGQGARR
jgi:hypothetical protein